MSAINFLVQTLNLIISILTDSRVFDATFFDYFLMTSSAERFDAFNQQDPPDGVVSASCDSRVAI